MSNRVIFTPAAEAAIAYRYQNGETCQAIAKSLGITFAIAKRVLVNQGVYEHGRRFAGRYSETDKAEMERLYLSGVTLGALGEQFGCDRLNVRHILRRRGVPLRSYRTYPLDPVVGEEIRKRRDDGLAFADIARELGYPPHRVLKWARQMGISDFVGKTGSDSHAWRGGSTIHNGYRYVRLNADDPLYAMAGGNSYAAEHRVVMARSLGRILTRGETVHHKNGDRLDSRLENLQLRMGQHGKGVVMTCLDCGSQNVTADAIAD